MPKLMPNQQFGELRMASVDLLDNIAMELEPISLELSMNTPMDTDMDTDTT